MNMRPTRFRDSVFTRRVLTALALAALAAVAAVVVGVL